MSLITSGLQFVKETSTTEGNTTPPFSLTLLGPPDGYESIITTIGNGNSGYFFLRHSYAWMRFRGTVTTPNLLSVDQVLRSSDSHNPLVLGPGTKHVYCAVDEYSGVGIRLLSQAAASNSAAVDFTGLSADFDEYVVSMVNVIPATNNVSLILRVSADAGVSFYANATDYAYTTSGATDSVDAVASSTGAFGLLIANLLSNAKYFCGSVQAFGPSVSGKEKLFLTDASFQPNGGTIARYSGAGSFKANTSPYNAIRFCMTSGNITGGTFRLYGVQKT